MSGIRRVSQLGTTNDSIDNITDVAIFSTPSYKVGDIGPAGGTIFITPTSAKNPSGKYFEVAPFSTEVSRTWASVAFQSTAVVGADGQGTGYGYQNTLDIIAQGNTDPETCAAKYCDDLVYGGYSDWFLPSKNETLKLGKALLNVDSLTGTYWTSVEEAYGNTSAAYYVELGTNYESTTQKSSTRKVRAVRSFSPPSALPISTSGDVLGYNGTNWANTVPSIPSANPAIVGGVYGRQDIYNASIYLNSRYQVYYSVSANPFTRTITLGGTTTWESLWSDNDFTLNQFKVGLSISINFYPPNYAFYGGYSGTIQSVTANSIVFSAAGFSSNPSEIITNALCSVGAYNNATGTNVSVGYNSLLNIATSSVGNTAIGTNALSNYNGSTPHTGSYNIAIGYDSGSNIPSTTSQAVIIGGHGGYDVLSGQVLISNGANQEKGRFWQDGFTVYNGISFIAFLGSDKAYTNPSEVTPILFSNMSRQEPYGVYNTSNGRFTAPIAGRYYFVANVWSASGSIPFHTWLIKNGSRYVTLGYNDDDWICAGSTYVYLYAGDWVAVGASMGGSGTGTLSQGNINTYFSGILIN